MQGRMEQLKFVLLKNHSLILKYVQIAKISILTYNLNNVKAVNRDNLILLLSINVNLKPQSLILQKQINTFNQKDLPFNKQNRRVKQFLKIRNLPAPNQLPFQMANLVFNAQNNFPILISKIKFVLNVLIHKFMLSSRKNVQKQHLSPM